MSFGFCLPLRTDPSGLNCLCPDSHEAIISRSCGSTTPISVRCGAVLGVVEAINGILVAICALTGHRNQRKHKKENIISLLLVQKL